MTAWIVAADVPAWNEYEFTGWTEVLVAGAAVIGFALFTILIFALQGRNDGPEKRSFTVYCKGKEERDFSTLGAAKAYVDRKVPANGNDATPRPSGIIVVRSGSSSGTRDWYKPTQADAWGIFGDLRKDDYSIVEGPRRVRHFRRFMVFMLIVGLITFIVLVVLPRVF